MSNNSSRPGMPATSVRLAAPRNLLSDDAGLYISDFGGHRVFQLSSAGLLSTLLGTGVRDIRAMAAWQRMRSWLSSGIGVGFDGSLYLADSLNHAIRRFRAGLSQPSPRRNAGGLALDVFGTLQVPIWRWAAAGFSSRRNTP